MGFQPSDADDSPRGIVGFSILLLFFRNTWQGLSGVGPKSTHHQTPMNMAILGTADRIKIQRIRATPSNSSASTSLVGGYSQTVYTDYVRGIVPNGSGWAIPNFSSNRWDAGCTESAI